MIRRMVRNGGRCDFLAGAGARAGHRCRAGRRLGGFAVPGTVAQLRPGSSGAKVKHDFVLTNRLGEPVTILNLRPSCGCTSGKASTSMVNPGETAAIEAQMDTRNFLGLKSTILYVTLVTASGREAEVRLGVSRTSWPTSSSTPARSTSAR